MMRVYNSNELIQNIRNKGIKINKVDEELFCKNDYYQVINAYKALFIKEIENLDIIYFNIDREINIDEYLKYFSITTYKDSTDLKNKINEKIIEKYELNSNNLDSLRKIDYIHHIYKENVEYNDFLRIYQFEHNLRNILLKYTLTIENNFKRIFINTLNNIDLIKDNFLTNIDNYNTDFKNNAKAIETLKKILTLHEKNYSKPISRKIHQNLNVPYWILINEMTFGEAICTVKVLKKEYRERIYVNLVKEFTGKELFYPKNNKIIRDFTRAIDYISNFRNVLAHNRPIFNYNHSNESLSDFPNLEFCEPKITIEKLNEEKNKHPKMTTKEIIKNYQHTKNKYLIKSCLFLFDKDYFNSRDVDYDLNLSFLVYLILKINHNIDKKSTMGIEIYKVFNEFNILINKKVQIKNDLINNDDIKERLDNLYSFLINNENLNKSYVAEEIKNIVIKIDEHDFINSNFKNEFKFNKNYEYFTGFTESILENFKNC